MTHVTFTPQQLVAAARQAAEEPEPFERTDEMGAILAGAIDPALAALPDHLRCELVAFELLTAYVMGLHTGVVLGRGT